MKRRDRAYIVTVGTRLYLARGKDEDHAREHLRVRYGYALTASETVVREATRADLDLADLINDTAEVALWRERVLRQTAP